MKDVESPHTAIVGLNEPEAQALARGGYSFYLEAFDARSAGIYACQQMQWNDRNASRATTVGSPDDETCGLQVVVDGTVATFQCQSAVCPDSLRCLLASSRLVERIVHITDEAAGDQ
jgi:hypothetical protein